MRQAEWVAVDTEADSLHAYPEKLCLMQISLPGRDELIDPLAGFDLAPLLEVLASREIILHGADYDLRLMHRERGFVAKQIFDTMIASRLLGVMQFGLTDLTRRFLGVELEKGPQKANWAKRPLTERMITYAKNDTHHLKPLSDLLRAQLETKGRLEWLRQSCDQLIQETTHRDPPDPDLIWRVKGCDRLERRGMAVVREIWHWREREAAGANLPPFFILNHDALIALGAAASGQNDHASLVPARYSPRRRAALLEAVERALALPESALPDHRRHRGEHFSLAQRQRFDRLKEKRDKVAEGLEIDPTLIASRMMLVTLAKDWEKNQEQLMPWQRELLAP